MSFVPAWRVIACLLPVDQGSLVAPLQQLAHSLPVSASEHEFLHGRFAAPQGSRPEGALRVAQQGDAEISWRIFGLPRGAESIKQEWEKVTPGAHAQAGDGDDRHT